MESSIDNRKKESFKIFNEIAGTYDLLNRILSMGIDRYWRKLMIKQIPPTYGQVALDLATGTADVALELSKCPFIERIEGLDPSSEMIKRGSKKITKSLKQDKIHLFLGNGQNIERPDHSYDLTTISFGIRNYGDPQKGLEEMYRVLKPQGVSLILEFSIPTFPLIKKLYLFYFRSVLPFIGNLISGHKDAYTYLNKTAENFPYGQEFIIMMKKAGFRNIRSKPLTFGIATLYRGEK